MSGAVGAAAPTLKTRRGGGWVDWSVMVMAKKVKARRGLRAADVTRMRLDVKRAASHAGDGSVASIVRGLKRIDGAKPGLVLTVEGGGAANSMNLRAHIATEVMAAMYSNEFLLQRAVADWDQNGGRRPTCVAEWLAGMACEAADQLLLELRGPSGSEIAKLEPRRPRF